MNRTETKPLALGLTVLSGLARLIPHVPNFTPVGGMSLFAGARISGWKAFALPLALMLVTDPLVGGYSFSTPFVYAAFLINVLIGRTLMRNSGSFARLGAVVLLCSTQFFLLTNFAVWLRAYPHTMAGLTLCYTEAIPFFGRTLFGDLFYSGVLFGLYAWLAARQPAAKPATV